MSSLAGTALLVRHHLRRDRILICAWVAILVLMCVASAAATPGIYPGEAERIHAAEAINANPAIVALYGPIVDVHSLGEIAMAKMTVTYALLLAVFFVVLVRRHTRLEEESGRAELTGGTAVGRDAPLTAGLIEASVVAVVLGCLVAVGNAVSGLPWPGSMAFGAMWAGTALVAAGVAALTSQLAASARTCAAWAAVILGIAYLVRAIGDTSAQWLSWLSPFGWNTRFSAYSDPQWWVLGLHIALAGVLVGAAVMLRSRRDLGSGLFAARPGPATGSRRLADAFSLALSLHTPTLIAWSAAMVAMGSIFGFIAPSIGDLLDQGTAAQILDKLGGALIGAVLSIIALGVSCFTIQVIGHAGSDEAAGRTELVLATATSRSRWLFASLAVASLGAALLLALAGVALWAGYLAAGGGDPGNLFAASLAWLPAVLVVTTLATALLALRSRWAPVAWALPIGFFALSLLGELLGLPGWVGGISPFSHVPQLPAAEFRWPPELALAAVAVAIGTAAWWRFRTRDIG